MQGNRNTKYFPLEGGLNETTPPLSMNGGELYGVSNYEPGADGGYSRIEGYERLDGQHSPSEADYWLVNFDAGTTAIVEGNEITNAAGATTSASKVGEVLADAVVESGSWATNDAAGYFYITRVSNRVDPTFTDNDTLYVSAASVATVVGIATPNGAATDADDSLYRQTAIEVLRARILAVPGSGKVRGTWMFNGIKYAFRDNAGGTACIMYQSTASGWSAADLGATMALSGVTGTFQKGEEITGGTSGATADVVDIVGTTLYITNVTGTFGTETVTGGTSGATATAGTVTTTTLLPGGRYELINKNFYGATNLRGMYGVDGVNPGFMLTTYGFRQIPTGMAIDAPIHVTEHKKHLFFMFPGGSVQHSTPGEPGDAWTPVLGAGEIATGDEGTGFVTLPGDTLGIFNRNSLYILYGTSAANWNLIQHSDKSGGIEWTIQRIGWPIFFDDRGLMDFRAVQDFGDFDNSSFSQKIRKTLEINKNKTLSSIGVRSKNQYRLFFTDNTFVICSFDDKKLSGFTTCEYPVTVECAASVEDTDGNEVLLFGSDNGYVYQMDKGTSFDGAAVDAFIRLAFNFINKAELNKKFFKAVFEVQAQTALQIQFTPDFDYGENEDSTQDLSVAAAGGVWDVSNWDEFVWGDKLISNPVAYIDGTGQNIGIIIYTSHTYENPHTLNSVIIHYSNKGWKR